MRLMNSRYCVNAKVADVFYFMDVTTCPFFSKFIFGFLEEARKNVDIVILGYLAEFERNVGCKQLFIKPSK